MAATDFTDISSILDTMQGLLNIPVPPSPPIPAPLILGTASRPGLSAQKMGAEVIRRRAEAGLPVGPLPDGTPNPAEELEIIRFQVLIDNFTTLMRTSITIQPGISLIATGVDSTGMPVVVEGLTTDFGIGYGIIQ